ncbi:MAG: SH3-like domain-containing protein [Flavobacteriia bacterium]|nr:SH3-like domain-containing protein [Flavobacteriia bacterium]
MDKRMIWKGVIAVQISLLVACGNEPKEVSTSEASVRAQEVFSSGSGTHAESSEAALGNGHVKVLEVLNASRYDYLKVAESSGKEYWLAARSGDFQVGTEYHYHDGLYKTNYYSTEFDRTFEEIYLVSGIHPVNGTENHEMPANHPPVKVNTPIEQPEGSTEIAEVVRNAESLAGKEVQVTGKVTKVNPHIMSRNWVHLQDGSMDSYDFVVTTSEDIPVGHTVTLKGVLSIDKDFGAGYTYDIILENASLVR